MKSTLKKLTIKKEKFNHFSKLSTQQLNSIRGGNTETPPDDETPIRPY